MIGEESVLVGATMRKLLTLIVILTALLPQTFAAAQDENASISFRFVNLTPNPIDLYRGGSVVFFGNETAAISAERVLPEAGEQTFEVFALNTTSDPLADLSVELTAGQNFLLIASQQGQTVQLSILEYDQQAIEVNRSRLEVLHLAETPLPVSIVGQNNDTLIENAQPAEVIRADVPAGNYQITILDPDNQELSARALNAPTGSLVTMIVYGSDSLRVLEIKQSLPQLGAFRFVHAMRLTGAVDVYFGDELVFSDIAYQDSTDYALLEPNTYLVRLFPAGELSDQPLWEGEVVLATNAPLTGVAFGENNLRLLTHVDNHLQIPRDESRIRFVNAALNMPLLTVRDDADEIIVADVEYALGSRNIVQAAETRSLIFAESGFADYVTLSDFNFQANHSYTFVIAGNALIDGNLEVLVLDWTWK
jgi:Domain of unknown function (DUF4397)